MNRETRNALRATELLKAAAEAADPTGVRNAFVVVLHNTRTGNIAASRLRVFDTQTNQPKPMTTEQETAHERRSSEEQGRAYARSLGWPETDTVICVIGPLTTKISQMVYDLMPGGRITIPQSDALFAELAKSEAFDSVVNLRRATDKSADN